MESSSTLKYAERARSALNSTQLSKTQVLEAKLSRLSQLYKELQAEFQQERDSMEREKLAMKLAHAQEVHAQQARHEQQVLIRYESPSYFRLFFTHWYFTGKVIAVMFS